MASLFMDGILAVLLLATIIYSGMLNRRLQGLRSNREELEVLIRSFNEACFRAESGVRTLRTATDEATRLQQYLERSQTLRDDLAFLLDRGSALADRLEGNVRTVRPDSGPRASATPLRPVASAPAPAYAQAPAQHVPMQQPAAPAMNGGYGAQPMDSGQMMAAPAADGADGRPLRERVGLRPPAGGAAAGDAPRSKAERDLLQALRTKR